MGLKDWLKRIERDAREGCDSFELRDGSTYYYDPVETYKELFLHAYDVELGDQRTALSADMPRTARGPLGVAHHSREDRSSQPPASR